MLSWLKRLLGAHFSRIDATVEVIGWLPPAVSDPVANQTVLYRVVTPQEHSGKYGIEGTLKSAEEINALKGTTFQIQRRGKWRHVLGLVPPLSASTSSGEDFFATAIPVRGPAGNP
jgi:hypothetical protein